MDRRNQVFLLGGNLVAQVHRLAREFLSLVAVSEGGVGSAQLGIGQRKIGILFGGGFKLLYGIKVFPLPRQLHSFGVVAQGLDRLRRRLERLRLKFLDGLRGQRQTFFDGLR